MYRYICFCDKISLLKNLTKLNFEFKCINQESQAKINKLKFLEYFEGKQINFGLNISLANPNGAVVA